MPLDSSAIKGLSDPFAFRNSSGEKDTLFFDREVVDLLVFPSKLVLPVWSGKESFDSDRIDEYRADRKKVYNAVEVDSHIDALDSPFVLGTNLTEDKVWLVRGDQDEVDYYSHDPSAVDSLVEWLFEPLRKLVDRSDRIFGSDVADAIADRLLSLGREVDASAADSTGQNTDHGIVSIKIGYDPPVRVVMVPPSLMPITSVHILDNETWSSQGEDPPYIYDPKFTIEVGFDEGERSFRQRTKQIVAKTEVEVVDYDDSLLDGHLRYQLVDDGGGTWSGDADMFDWSLVLQADRDYSSSESAFPNGRFSLWRSEWLYALDIIGYVPYPSSAVLALSGVERVSETEFSLADRQVSALIDNARLAEFYANSASKVSGDMASKLSKVSEGLSGLTPKFGGVFAPDPGLPTRASVGNTQLASLEGASTSEIRAIQIADSRIDDKDGPMTLGILEQINNEKAEKRPALPGLALPIATFSRPAPSSSDFVWVYDDSVSDFVPQDGNGNSADIADLKADHDNGKTVEIEFGESGLSVYQAYLSDNEDADFRSWVESVNSEAVEYSSLSSSPARNKKLVGWDEYGRRYQTLYYFGMQEAGLSKERMNSAEGRLLATANGAFEYARIAAPHVFGLFGKVPKE